MRDTNEKTLPSSRHPSLLPLRMVLIAAETGVPSRPDLNEQLAQILITRIKTEYRKPLLFTSWKKDSNFRSFRLQEVIRSNA